MHARQTDGWMDHRWTEGIAVTILRELRIRSRDRNKS